MLSFKLLVVFPQPTAYRILDTGCWMLDAGSIKIYDFRRPAKFVQSYTSCNPAGRQAGVAIVQFYCLELY